MARGPAARQAGEVHRDPQREPGQRPPRPRPVAEAHALGGEGRHRHRLQGRAARRPRAPTSRSSAAACRCSARSCSTRSTSSRPTSSTVPDGAHQQDLDRRLPRRRPARGDVRHRADDGRARRRGRRRPARDPREELDQARGVPVHDGGRAGVRLRQLRGRDRPGQGDVRVRRAARRAEAAPRVRATRSSSASASRRSPRCAAWRRVRVLGSLDYGAGGWEHASVRMLATGKVEVVTGASAHGQGHETAFSQIVADRLGVRVRGRRGAARRHPDRRTRAATPTARGRWSSAARRWSGPPTR